METDFLGMKDMHSILGIEFPMEWARGIDGQWTESDCGAGRSAMIHGHEMFGKERKKQGEFGMIEGTKGSGEP